MGEGPERNNLKKIISEKELSQFVILAGADTNPYKYMKAADMYVQTSLYEGFSITVREALALGKPVITTDFPSVYSAVRNNVNGLITPMLASSIADAILQLSSSPTLSNSLTQGNVAEAYERESGKIKSLTRILFDNQI